MKTARFKSANVLLLVSWMVFAAIAFIIPPTPLTHAWAKELVAVVALLAPAIARLQTLSPIPEIAQFYWATMLILSLLMLPIYFMLRDEQVRPLQKARKRAGAFRVAIIVPVGVLIYVFFLPFIGPIGRVMVDSRLGLGLIGGFLLAAVPFMVRAAVTWWRYQPLLGKANSNERANNA